MSALTDFLATNQTPVYEIWGVDDANADPGFATRGFREDCWTIDEARRARSEWQTDGRAAWISYCATCRQRIHRRYKLQRRGQNRMFGILTSRRAFLTGLIAAPVVLQAMVSANTAMEKK